MKTGVSKHFVLFLSTSPFLACLLCCLLMSLFFGCFVVRDLCKFTFFPSRPHSSLPRGCFFLSTQNSLSNTSVWLLFEISAYLNLKLVSVPFSSFYSLYFVIGHLEKRPGEHHVKLWDGTKLMRFACRVCIVHYHIVFSFHLAKRMNHPDPGWDS